MIRTAQLSKEIEYKMKTNFQKYILSKRWLLAFVLLSLVQVNRAKATDRDSLQKVHIEASVKLLNRAITHNTLKKPAIATKYLVDRLNYVSADAQGKIEKVLEYLQKTTGKELYVIITRSPDMVNEQDAEAKFKQETKRFTDQVYARSMLGTNGALVTINFVKLATKKKIGVKTTYLQGTGIAVGNDLAQNIINQVNFQTTLQNDVKNANTADDLAKLIIYQVHQKAGNLLPDLNLQAATSTQLTDYEEKLGFAINSPSTNWASVEVVELDETKLTAFNNLDDVSCGKLEGALTPTGQTISTAGMTNLKYWEACNGSLIYFTYAGKRYRHITIKGKAGATCGGKFLGYYPVEDYKNLLKQRKNLFKQVKVNGTRNVYTWEADEQMFGNQWFKEAQQTLVTGKKVGASIKSIANLIDKSLIPTTSLTSFRSQIAQLGISCNTDYCWTNLREAGKRIEINKRVKGLIVPTDQQVQTKGSCPPVKKGYGLLVYAKYIKEVKNNKTQREALIEFADFLSEELKSPLHFSLVDLSKNQQGVDGGTTISGKRLPYQKFELTNRVLAEIFKRGFKSLEELKAYYKHKFKARVSGTQQEAPVLRDVYATHDLWFGVIKTGPKAYNAKAPDHKRPGHRYMYTLNDLIMRYRIINDNSSGAFGRVIQEAERKQKALPIDQEDGVEQYRALFGTNSAVYFAMQSIFVELEPIPLRASILRSARRVFFKPKSRKTFSNLTPDEVAAVVKNVNRDGILRRLTGKLKPSLKALVQKTMDVKGLLVSLDKTRKIISIGKVTRLTRSFAVKQQVQIFLNQGNKIQIDGQIIRKTINGVAESVENLGKEVVVKVKKTGVDLSGKMEIAFIQGKMWMREQASSLAKFLPTASANQIIQSLRQLPENLVQVTRQADDILIKDLAKNTLAALNKKGIQVKRWVDLTYGGTVKNVKGKVREIFSGRYLAKNKNNKLGICLRDGTCFVAGTLIYASSSLQPIEQIQAGNQVYAGDPQSCSQTLKGVEATFVRTTPVLVKLGFLQESIYATPEHPFFGLKNQQILAGNIKKGDTLKTYNGYAIVQNTRTIDTTATVYNFHVKDFHTYYVGRTKLWVHNMMSHSLFDASVDARLKKLKINSTGDNKEAREKFIADMGNHSNFNAAVHKDVDLVDSWWILYKLKMDEAARTSISTIPGQNTILEVISKHLKAHSTKKSSDLFLEIKWVRGYERWVQIGQKFDDKLRAQIAKLKLPDHLITQLASDMVKSNHFLYGQLQKNPKLMGSWETLQRLGANEATRIGQNNTFGTISNHLNANPGKTPKALADEIEKVGGMNRWTKIGQLKAFNDKMRAKIAEYGLSDKQINALINDLNKSSTFHGKVKKEPELIGDWLVLKKLKASDAMRRGEDEVLAAIRKHRASNGNKEPAAVVKEIEDAAGIDRWMRIGKMEVVNDAMRTKIVELKLTDARLKELEKYLKNDQDLQKEFKAHPEYVRGWDVLSKDEISITLDNLPDASYYWKEIKEAGGYKKWFKASRGSKLLPNAVVAQAKLVLKHSSKKKDIKIKQSKSFLGKQVFLVDKQGKRIAEVIYEKTSGYSLNFKMWKVKQNGEVIFKSNVVNSKNLNIVPDDLQALGLDRLFFAKHWFNKLKPWYGNVLKNGGGNVHFPQGKSLESFHPTPAWINANQEKRMGFTGALDFKSGDIWFGVSLKHPGGIDGQEVMRINKIDESDVVGFSGGHQQVRDMLHKKLGYPGTGVSRMYLGFHIEIPPGGNPNKEMWVGFRSTGLNNSYNFRSITNKTNPYLITGDEIDNILAPNYQAYVMKILQKNFPNYTIMKKTDRY
ncbi:MAG TPA: hypothetical protein DCS93_13790 [Microscillaceae bacterium]|nr:hypothetical protein [Microscillaceae bacterium]